MTDIKDKSKIVLAPMQGLGATKLKYIKINYLNLYLK